MVTSTFSGRPLVYTPTPSLLLVMTGPGMGLGVGGTGVAVGATGGLVGSMVGVTTTVGWGVGVMVGAAGVTVDGAGVSETGGVGVGDGAAARRSWRSTKRWTPTTSRMSTMPGKAKGKARRRRFTEEEPQVYYFEFSGRPL